MPDIITDGGSTVDLSKIEEKYKGTGRLLLRPSGTEPLVRIMIEGEKMEEIKKDAEMLASVVEQAMSRL